MRVAFLGTPGFAATSLRALLDASRHEVVAVVSQPDRPAGRGNRLVSPPVAELAKERGLPLIQPDRVGTEEFRAWFADRRADLGVVVAYGHVLGPKLLAIPPRGFVNVHASLLPRWRGAGPIQAALLAGDPETGISIMEMEAGLDTGPVLLREALPIPADATGESLHDALADLGARLLVRALDHLEEGPLPARPQPEQGVTWAPMLRREDADLDWSSPAEVLERRIRALHPWPGTRTRAGDESLKVLPPATVLAGRTSVPAQPGTVLAASGHGVDVACGDGTTLRLHRLQAPGRRPLEAGAFLAGFDLVPGTVLR